MRTGLPPTVRRLPGPGWPLALAGALLLHAWVLQALHSPGSTPRAQRNPHPRVVPWQAVARPGAPSRADAPFTGLPGDTLRTAQAAEEAGLARSGTGSAPPRPDAPARQDATLASATRAEPTGPGTALESPSNAAWARQTPVVSQTSEVNPTPRPSRADRSAEPVAAEPGRPWALPATRLPPAFEWTFAVRRGPQQGLADLRWQPQGEQYELSLETRGVGPQGFGQISRGGFDAAGLAPDRFVDRRRGRDRLAVNFDRSSGQLTFSGPQVRHPLVSGAQDRLSWMVQLAAVLEADPVRWRVGERVPLFVAGPRGDADTWWFQIQAREPVELADGSTREALRITREPTRPYDTRVDAWLDPQRHHLPLRLRLQPIPAGDALEYSLLRQAGSVGVP